MQIWQAVSTRRVLKDVRRPTSATRRRGPICPLRGPAFLLVAAALLIGCETEIDDGLLDGDLDQGTGVNCAIDSSTDIESAYEGGFTTASDDPGLSDTLCPASDADFWRFTTTDDNQIASVLVEFVTANDVSLAAEWWGPVGSCVRDPEQSCTQSTACDAGDYCDPLRGLCRVDVAVPCALDGGCDVDDACVTAAALIVDAYETPTTGTSHLIRTSLPATEAGDYFLKVSSIDTGFIPEEDKTYSLTATEMADPDANEPNDAANLATASSSGATVEGYLAYAEDEDWFRIPYAFAGRPVVTVDLSWPVDAGISATWVVSEADWQCSPGEAVTEGTGPTARRVRKGACIGQPGSEILVAVSHQTGVAPQDGYDVDDPYSLTVTVETDPDEVGDRNDTPSTATVLDASGFGTLHSASHTIVAPSDADWYRIDKATSDNSLVHFIATATTDEYLLSAIFYQPTGATCSPNTNPSCGGSTTCICPRPANDCGSGEGVCIEPWVFRPIRQDFLINDEWITWQEGGYAPNHVETQLPLFRQGTGALYIKVEHLSSANPARDGYGSAPYDLAITHKQEPQSAERSADPSEFFPNPFNVEEDTFISVRRIEASGSNNATMTGYISYDGDQDWYQFNTGISGETNVRVHLSLGASPLDLRFDVRRGGSSTGAGPDSDYCPGDYRNACSHGAVNSDVVNPDNGCYHFRAGSSTFYLHVNDAEFNDWDDQPYQVTLELEPGCTNECNFCRCEASSSCDPYTCNPAGDGACRTSCSSSDDCISGYACRSSVCCPSGQLNCSGTCQDCCDDGDCTGTDICQGGVCVAPPPT